MHESIKLQIEKYNMGGGRFESLCLKYILNLTSNKVMSSLQIQTYSMYPIQNSDPFNNNTS